MREVSESDLSEIKPYDDAEVPAAIVRLAQSPVAEKVRGTYFPFLASEEFRAKLSKITTSAQFQKEIVAPAVDALLSQSSEGFTVRGLDRNSPKHKCVFISNHRDILCDPALFTYAMVKTGWDSPLICLGDNLLVAPWIVDIIKINGGVTVKRNLSQRELLKWSYTLSELISRAVTSQKSSVWIAQREGRAKDGNDCTHSGVIKMLSLSSHASDAPLATHLGALRVVPVSVSYEFDPTDAMKARELCYSARPEGYQKRPGEDVQSMAMGLAGDKGRIHIEIGDEIRQTIEKARAMESRKDQINLVVEEIDRQIQTHYKLWPSNFIAYDLLHESSRFHQEYERDEISHFLERMESQLATLQEDGESLTEIRQRFLAMYAAPVENFLLKQTPESPVVQQSRLI